VNKTKGARLSLLYTFLTAVKPRLQFLAAIVFAGLALALPPSATSLLQFEQQYVNRTLDETKIVALKNYQAAQYSPENALIFDVKSFWIPGDEVDKFSQPEFENKLPFKLSRLDKDGRVEHLMLIHPESETFFKDFLRGKSEGPIFKATATASSRTLMMWAVEYPDSPFFGKLSLNKEVAGVVRTIPKGEVSRSVGVSLILQNAKNQLPKEFAFFPEFFGLMPKGMERGGMLLRSFPEELYAGNKKIMPLFAVYTRPGSKGLSPIESMISKSGLSPKEFLSNFIISPFAKQWVDLAVNHGIVVEAHAQNVLIQIGKDGLPSGKFVYRDFGGFNIDLNYRRGKGLAMPAHLPVIESESKDYHQEFHRQALRQSIETYFEGGFLFGLGQEMERLGYSSLDYAELKDLLHKEIRKELKKMGASGFLFSRFENAFYQNLDAVVTEAKSNRPAGAVCNIVF
jgi:hypothetical protein